MYSAEVITPQHLARKAVIYIRQSTPHQALSHQESLRLQYALTERARALGWAAEAIDVIDTDVGQSDRAPSIARASTPVSQATLGQVGLILSDDVTRLLRNCSGCNPPLDLCGYKSCLIADVDGRNDRHGQWPVTARVEGHPVRMGAAHHPRRITAGLLNKAARGDLALTLPTGLERDSLGGAQRPNLEVQARITLVFETFLSDGRPARYWSFSMPVAWASSACRHHFGGGRLETSNRRRAPLHSEAPGVCGHLYLRPDAPALRPGSAAGRAATKRLAMEQWRMRVPDKAPRWTLSWATFEQIQTILRDNHAEYDRNKTRGIPRPGKALLHGRALLRRCRDKMVVQYKGGTEYLCNSLRQQYRVPVCQYVPADPVDARLSRCFSVLLPIELDMYTQTMDTQHQQAERLDAAHRQQLPIAL